MLKPKPIWANIIVTRKCNLDCTYCFVRKPTKEELSATQTREVIDKLYFLGCRFVDFTGGEPTLRNDLPELVKHASQKPMVTRITTNGTLLTPEYIETLAKAGIDIINVSIDSTVAFDQSMKDYIRSRKIITDLTKARERFGFEIETNLTMTRKNLDRVTETIKLMHDLEIPIAICIVIRNTYSNAPMDEDLLFKSSEDKERLFRTLDEIKKLKRQQYNIIDPMQYFDDIKRFVSGNLNWQCLAGTYSLSVDCDGRFQLCYLLPAEPSSIFEIDRSYYKTYAGIRKERMSTCSALCLHNCGYDPSYFFRHPLYFLRELLANRLFQRGAV